MTDSAGRTLITGGAGFIGSHLADALLASGRSVRVLDSLVGQVHGDGERPDYLSPEVELLVGDVRDPDTVSRALEGVREVVHLAARVGVGQSMYELVEYTAANSLGTAVLLEAIVAHQPARLLVASSMSIYGEGLYRTADGSLLHDATRTREQLELGEWEPVGPDGEPLEPVPTPETKTPALTSTYALTKYDQERLCLIFGDAYRIPTVALRFFNVYGPRQALSNPYTGVMAIFAARLLNDRPPLIFEDGRQSRDFVNVADVVRACVHALESPQAPGHAINVGSGDSVTVAAVASELASLLGKDEIQADVTGKYRAGDIRHCFGDSSRAQELLGYEPSVGLQEGLGALVEWLQGQVAQDGIEAATRELASRGLTI